MNTRNRSTKANPVTQARSANRVRPLAEVSHAIHAETSPIPKLLTTTERAINRMNDALASNRAALESLNTALSKAVNYNSHSDGDESKDKESEDVGSEIANTFNAHAIELESQTSVIRELINRIDL